MEQFITVSIAEVHDMRENHTVFTFGIFRRGETTLLQRMLGNYAAQSVGVLVNEFGQLGIDGRLIESAVSA
jgi:hypothetical protein